MCVYVHVCMCTRACVHVWVCRPSFRTFCGQTAVVLCPFREGYCMLLMQNQAVMPPYAHKA